MSVPHTDVTAPDKAQAQAASQYLTFFLADEEYGIPILRVQEICGRSRITPVPNVPDHMLGVVNLRGDIVPILDLRQRFGMPSGDDDGCAVCIMVMQGDRIVGMAADGVSDVLNVHEDEIAVMPELGARVQESLISGMARRDEHLVMLLDIDAVLDGGGSPDLEVDEASPASPQGHDR